MSGRDLHRDGGSGGAFHPSFETARLEGAASDRGVAERSPGRMILRLPVSGSGIGMASRRATV
jgi:hypothetical protein